MKATPLLLVAVLLAASPLLAQRGRPVAPLPDGVSDVLALARICRHKSGFPPRRGRGVRAFWDHGDDCPAIAAVIERVRLVMSRHRGARATTAQAVHAYSRGRIFDTTRTDGACDVSHLTLDGAEPACWRSRIPWSMRRAAWLAQVEHAGRVLAGEVPSACVIPPHHWGCGPVQTKRGCRDHLRAERAGWLGVDCGVADNTFYVDPAILEREREVQRRRSGTETEQGAATKQTGAGPDGSSGAEVAVAAS